VKAGSEMLEYRGEETKTRTRNAKLKEEVRTKGTEIQCQERTLTTEILSKTMGAAVLVDRRHWDARKLNTKGISKV
jgi:hypothetical protein